MPRLNILFLPLRYPSENHPVAGVFVQEQVHAVALYNDVTVMYVTNARKSLNGFCKISDEIENGVRILRITSVILPIPKTNLLINLWSTFIGFQKLVNDGFRPDIIHAHFFPAGVPAVILGKLYGIPVIITEHWSRFPQRTQTTLDKIKARFAMNRAEMVLPVSDKLREHIEYYGIKNRFLVVPNVVNTEIFYPPSDKDKRKAKKKKILMVALLKPIKGIPYALEALSQIKVKRSDFILDIVGDGPKRREYEELTIRLGLNGFVKFHGLKSRQEVAEFMRNSNFFILPSVWESSPCVLIEAMASELPVVATDVGGVREIFDRSGGMLIPSENVEALTNAIEYMLDNYNRYSSRDVGKYARERFSYEAIGKMLDKIYRQQVRK